MINLNIPFPPTVNHMWGQSGHRKFLKKSAHEFRLKVQEEVIAKSAKITGRLAIFIALYAPTRRNYDIDNRCKAVLDALQHSGVFEDDEQVDFIWISLGRHRTKNRIKIGNQWIKLTIRIDLDTKNGLI